MDEKKLSRIEATAAAATPGPWGDCAKHIYAESGAHDGRVVAIGRMNKHADQSFVAAARFDVPALCAALREGWAERDRALAGLAAAAFADDLAEMHRACGGAQSELPADAVSRVVAERDALRAEVERLREELRVAKMSEAIHVGSARGERDAYNEERVRLAAEVERLRVVLVEARGALSTTQTLNPDTGRWEYDAGPVKRRIDAALAGKDGGR